tara:strand:- start:229 stop:456 length:228 start_codon:yes stop_codon:yes gene_type:complete
MIDPITAFTAASAAFSGLKKAIAVGKDLTSMGSQLSTWSKAVADLDFLEQKAKIKRDAGRAKSTHLMDLWTSSME